MPLSQQPWIRAGDRGCEVRRCDPFLAVVGPERETVLVDREWELLERAGSPWGFSPSLFRCSWQHLCLCFPPGKRVVGLFCPEWRKPIGHCAWLVASDLRGFLLASGLGPCPLGMKASQWATASPIKVGEDMYAHVLQEVLMLRALCKCGLCSQPPLGTMPSCPRFADRDRVEWSFWPPGLLSKTRKDKAFPSSPGVRILCFIIGCSFDPCSGH